MNGAGQQFFTCARFTGDHDVSVTDRNGGGHVVNLLHGERATDYAGKIVTPLQFRMQVTVLSQEAFAFKSLGDGQLDLIILKRFGNIVVGSGAQRLHRILDRAVSRNHDNRQRGLILLKFCEQLQAIHFRHFDIGDHKIKTFAGNQT